MAEDLITSLRNLGGLHTLDDLAAIQATWGEPVSGSYGDVTLMEHPPNGQGATAIILLNILRHFDIASMDPNGS